MVIYIPSHLEETLPIVKQMSQLIQGYSEVYGQTNTLGSFDDYYTHYSSDSVRRFIELCLPSPDPSDYLEDPEKLKELQDIRTGTINYLVKLFYSVKGTRHVFKFMKDHLNIDMDLETVEYTINYLKFTINEVTVQYDLHVFITSMKEFLSALLYYGDLATIIELVNFKIKEIISNNISLGISRYKEFTVTREYNF